jgi:3-carboxy-cis,cis-muconate cycloisomerase/3-oxoadipate enol-lactonase
MSNGLNSFLFSTPQMSSVFSQREQLRAMMRFEWALTCALEKYGLAETGSNAVLAALLDATFVDTELLVRDARAAGNIAMPFVRQLTATVKARSEVAARSVHLGATSQDVLDSALVLQMREALTLIDAAIEQLEGALVNRVREHRNTVLMGRTWLQAGPPTTLGLKLAGSLAALRRNRERIRSAAARTLVIEFGGAVGTLAALGTAGGVVSAEVAKLLDLAEPELPWHTQRDNLVDMVQVLAILTGTLAKFATDIALLMQSEVGEAGEESGEGRGASSTMPHKHNPVACAAVIATHARMPGLAATMLHAMAQQHERGLGLWQAEWETVPEAFQLTAAALAYSVQIAEGLQADAARMRSNLDGLLGLPLSEAVNAALAPKLGRSFAHDLLQAATGRAAEQKRNLAEILKELPQVRAHLTDVEIDRLLEPGAYLGSAQRFVSRVLGEGVGLHYELSGAAEGPVLVLANSLGSNLHMWDKVLPWLEKSFRILRYDMRGHGESSVPLPPYTLDQLGGDLLALMDQLSIDRVHLCGLSLGGLVAMWAGIHAPQRLGRLIFANTAARIGTHEGWEQRIAMVESSGMEGLALQTLERWFTPAYRAQHPAEMETIREMVAATDRAGYCGCCAALGDSDLRGAISAIDAPCLVISGTHDPATPAADGRAIHAAVKNSRYAELDCSHLSAWEKAEEFAGAVLAFLGAQ